MNNPAITLNPWGGVLTLAPMISMFVGEGGDTKEHLHPAHKVVLGAHSVHYDNGQHGGGSIVVPAGIPHSVCAEGKQVIIAFLDARRFHLHHVQALVDHRQSSWPDQTSTCTSLQDSSASLLSAFLTLPVKQLGSQIKLILAALSEHDTITAAANSVGLSKSRFTHLLSQQFGTPPGTWRSWMRLRDAIDEVAKGASVTTAAHQAGFSDASHFSRSCRSTLGIAPSALSTGRLKVVYFVGS